MHLLGLDVGSSSIKAALVNAETGAITASATSPETELEMISLHPGWAEQHPDTWWEHIKLAISKLKAKAPAALAEVEAIGISYQMHGLVVVDKDWKALRPSIIWCDSRAVEIGEKATQALGNEFCLNHYLNAPGNFTAGKLKWVQDNEPELYAKIHKFMLPGDYIALRLSGTANTTVSGLSEGILWDIKENTPAYDLLKYYGISTDLIPEINDSFGLHGTVSQSAADELGLKAGIKITYRAGDQPNNAFSLNVLNPGEIAANAGTSGVIYGINPHAKADAKSRVNSFVHVNHTQQQPRYGVLACVNGTGILNSWVRRLLSASGETIGYDAMNHLAATAPIGSEGLTVLPFGNGAERTLENRETNAQFAGIDFNRHSAAHILRATQEGIVFALNYGFEIMKGMGIEVGTVKAGYANMFLSPVFREAFANTTGAEIQLFNADGAAGAARAAGVGAGIFGLDTAFKGLDTVATISPQPELADQYAEAYGKWKAELEKSLV